jgi:hypothetical protein
VVQFAIVFSGRCGSNLLTRMLRAHPEIDLSALEAFAEEPAARGSRRAPADDDDGAAFAGEVIFGEAPPDAKAIGFKLAYHHAAAPPQSTLWDHLGKGEIRVVHLTRPNILDYVISLRLAQTQGKWVAVDARGQYDRDPVEISFNLLRDSIVALEGHARRVRMLVPDDRRFELTYDDLVARPRRVVRRVCRFLGVKRKWLAPRTIRQRTFSQRQAVTNYEQLRSAVSRQHPDWSRFFTD